MDRFQTGATLFSRGLRRGNAALTFIGAVLVARAFARWLERPDRELLYSKRLKPGQSLRIGVSSAE